MQPCAPVRGDSAALNDGLLLDRREARAATLRRASRLLVHGLLGLAAVVVLLALAKLVPDTYRGAAHISVEWSPLARGVERSCLAALALIAAAGVVHCSRIRFLHARLSAVELVIVPLLCTSLFVAALVPFALVPLLVANGSLLVEVPVPTMMVLDARITSMTGLAPLVVLLAGAILRRRGRLYVSAAVAILALLLGAAVAVAATGAFMLQLWCFCEMLI